MWNSKDNSVKIDSIIERNAYDKALNIHLDTVKQYIERKNIEEIENGQAIDSTNDSWPDQAL